MKLKTKKLIGILSGLTAFAVLSIWYFFPVLAYQYLWFYYAHIGIYQKELEVVPTYIDRLAAPPQEWNDIHIGELSFKLPNVTCAKVLSDENSICFISDRGRFLIGNLTPDKELLEKKEFKYPTYRDRVAILKSIPADISFLNTRNKNMLSYTNQILKFISIPNGGLSESLIVAQQGLKAICIISEKRENGFSAVAEIYNNSESMTFNITIVRYNEKNALKTDLLRILASVKMPAHPLDIVAVRKDLDALTEKYAKN